MKNRALLSAFTFATLAFGCATQAPWAQGGHPPPSQTCDEDAVKCDVTVAVTSCTPDGITLNYPVLGVAKGKEYVDIRWTIVTSDYYFAKDIGIKFKGSGWPNEFDQPSGNKNKFRWRDRNYSGTGQPRPYDYSVTIVHKDGSPCATKDPTVVNDI
jgi:hypothetical protein